VPAKAAEPRDGVRILVEQRADGRLISGALDAVITSSDVDLQFLTLGPGSSTASACSIDIRQGAYVA